MNSQRLTAAAAILILMAPAAALAQSGDGSSEDLDVTIRLMREGESEVGDVTRTITLPDSVPEGVSRDVPGENAGTGDGGQPDDAGGADDVTLPEGVDSPGLEVAEDAVAGEGGELGRELRDRALDNREELGRGQGPPDDLPAAGDGGAPLDDVPMPDGPSAGAGPPDGLPDGGGGVPDGLSGGVGPPDAPGGGPPDDLPGGGPPEN